MSVNKHRTLLFAADLAGSQQSLGRCTILSQDTVFGKAGDGVVLPGTEIEDDGPKTGWRVVPTVGRGGNQLNVWDGTPGPSRSVEAMIFPDLEKTHSMVTWNGQSFGAFSTQWETLHSPLVAVNPRPKPTPVVDSCGMVIAYHLKKISTGYLFATEGGEIFCTGYVTNSSMYGPHTRSLIGNALYVTDADKIVDGASLTSDMVTTERIKKDRWADVLVDIDGFVLAIDSYADPKAAPSTFDVVVGFLLPTPPDASCVHNEFGEPVEDQTWECAKQQSMFLIDLFLLIAPLSKIKNLAKARKLLSATQAAARRLKVGAQAVLRGARGTNQALRLTIHVPQIELKAATAAASGGKQAKKLLGAEKSGKKANFMEVDLGNKTGMTHMAIRDIRAKMKKLGVRIRFRPAGTARKLRKRGAVPKWEELKMKTINDDDILLGAPKSGKSQPGYFQPKLPDPKLKNVDPEKYERVMKRYKQREEEYRELAEKVKKYEKDGDIILENGVVKDGATGKDIAGDYDIYEILDKNGKRITDGDPRYNKILKDLEGRRIGAQHGAHVEWKPKDPFEKKIYDDIVERHRSKEPLYEFREDGSIWETFAD